MTPWLITLPLMVPNDARSELMELAHNRSTAAYIRYMHALRNRERPRAKSYKAIGFPPTCFNGKGYVIAWPKTNVITPGKFHDARRQVSR